MGRIYSKVDVMTVDKDKRKPKFVFERHVFSNYEWETLKAFCEKHDIKQKDLVVVFKKFLSNDEVYLRGFRVRTVDAKNKFLTETKLMQEIADTIIPSLFLKDTLGGLDPSYSSEEVSFSRFAINSYLFSAQQFPDMVLDFISMLKQRFNVQLKASMFYFNLTQIVTLLTEDLQPTESVRTLLICLQQKPLDQEITILSLLILSVKYPILFYSLERFRKKYRRVVFGDNFWLGRKRIKSKIKEVYRSDDSYQFNNAKEAIQVTATSIISDTIQLELKKYSINEQYYSHISVLTKEECDRLVDVFGYSRTKMLIIESNLKLSFTPLFLNEYPLADTSEEQNNAVLFKDKNLESNVGIVKGVDIIRDQKTNRNFFYDVNTGNSGWAQHYVSEDGMILKEI
eukprot:gene10920-14659_t